MAGRAVAAVAAAELTGGLATFTRAFASHPFISVWFILLMFAGAWFLLRAAYMVQAGEVDLPLAFSEGDGVLVVLLLFAAKGTSDCAARLVRNREAGFALHQPCPPGAVALGSLFAAAVSNVLLAESGLGIVVVVNGLSDRFVALDPLLAAALPLAALSGTALGFHTSLFMARTRPSRRPDALAPILAASATAYGALHYTPFGAVPILLATAIGPALAILLPRAADELPESWCYYSSQRGRWGRPGRRNLLARLLGRFATGPAMAALIEKETLLNLQWREASSAVLMIAVIGAIPFAVDHLTGSPQAGGMLASLLYPVLLAFLIYLVSLLVLGIPLISALGGEGSAAWVVKSAPVLGREVFSAKAVALLPLVPLATLAVAVPYPLYAGYSWGGLWFFAIGGAAVSFTVAAGTLWAGARYPNFNEGTDHMPDIAVVYLTVLVLMGLCAVVLGVPAAVYLRDRLLGLLVLLFAADWAALLLVVAVGRAGKRYDAMELP